MSSQAGTEELRARVNGLMPQITSELETLVAIPSVSIAGYPESTHTGLAAAESEVTRVFAESGVERFDVVNLFDYVYEIRDGSGIGVFAPQYGPRRTFFVGLAQKF